MNLPICVGITGASGAIYAVRLLEVLRSAGRDVHLSISSSLVSVDRSLSDGRLRGTLSLPVPFECRRSPVLRHRVQHGLDVPDPDFEFRYPVFRRLQGLPGMPATLVL